MGAVLVRKADLAEASDAEMLNKVQGQLLNALELLQVYQEGEARPGGERPSEQQPLVGVAPNQLKFTEKRRNKFEFIRFGRR